jgi:membrane-associated protein
VEPFDWILRTLRDPGDLIRWGGYPVIALVVFLETGALVFFLPGDSLLVVAGLYAAKGELSLLLLNVLLIPAAILGDALSYAIGRKGGPLLFNRPRSRFFRPDHLRAAHEFYERHGGKTIVLARFMPIFRTFVPVAAGIASMGYRRFATYNVLGGTLWVLSMTCTGYFLGSAVPGIQHHIEKVILLVVLLSILPGVVGWLRARRKGRGAPPSPGAPGEAESNP